MYSVYWNWRWRRCAAVKLYVHRERVYDAVRARLVAAYHCVVPPSAVDATSPLRAAVYLSADARHLLTEAPRDDQPAAADGDGDETGDAGAGAHGLASDDSPVSGTEQAPARAVSRSPRRHHHQRHGDDDTTSARVMVCIDAALSLLLLLLLLRTFTPTPSL